MEKVLDDAEAANVPPNYKDNMKGSQESKPSVSEVLPIYTSLDLSLLPRLRQRTLKKTCGPFMSN